MSAVSPISTPRAEFWAGVRATLPLIVGALPFGLIFGAPAVNSGLSLPATAGFSAIVFAGSAQFIAAGLVASGVGVGFIILTTLIVNLRHALYAATLVPHTAHLPQRWLIPLAFWLTDETFVVVASRYAAEDDSPHKHWYFFGSALVMYINWQKWTWLGILVGQSILNPGAWGLDFALVVTFIGMLMPFVANRKMLLAVLAAGVMAVLANGLPNKLGLMVASLVGVGVGLDWYRRQKTRLGGESPTGGDRHGNRRGRVNEFLLILGMAAVTFGPRYAPLALLRRFTLPDPLRRGLGYVPPVVLMAIVAPAMLPADNRLDVSLGNAYLWAGLISFAIAWRWKNLLLTIVAGMGVFLLWRVMG